MNDDARQDEHAPPPQSYDPVRDRWYTPTSWARVGLADAKKSGVKVRPPCYLTRSDGVATLYPGRSHSFFGESESLKSWAAMLACASVLADGGSALYLDFESDVESFLERLHLIGVPDGLLDHRIRYVRPEEPLPATGDARADLTAAATDLFAPDLVVVDGVTEAMSLHGLHPYDPKDAARYQHLLVRPWLPRSCVIEIDHTGKDPGRGQLGSQQKRAGLDGASFEFVPVQSGGVGLHGIAEMRLSKDRHGRVRGLVPSGVIGHLHVDSTPGQIGPAVYLDPPSGWPNLSAADRVMDRVLVYLRDHPGSNTNAVTDAKLGRATEVHAALKRAEASGDVTCTAGPHGAKFWSLAP